jgi:hypothetical protein
MSCVTHAEKKMSANACTDALGKRRVAGASFTGQTRKPKHQAPPFPQYDRVEANGRVAILINDGRGWLAHCHDGVHQNPWTGAPFNQLVNAKKAIKARLKFGKWPGKVT